MRGKGRDLPRPPGKVEVKAGVSLMLVAALDALGLPTPPQGPCHFSCLDSDSLTFGCDTLEALDPQAIH